MARGTRSLSRNAALAAGQCYIHVHALVQNAHDLDDAVRTVAVENDVASLRELAITGLDVVAALPGPRAIGQEPERVIELHDVEVSLVLAPTLLRVNRNGAQVALRFLC